jgi:hypothetical protein
MASAAVAETRYDPRADALTGLDARLVAGVRGGAPLRRALACLAGRLLAARAWEALGFARPADYARERPGLSSRELQDLAHVDAALAKLPAIDAALTAGQLGGTKARLLCRVAKPEDDARWLAAAGRLLATALAREVRACDVGALEAAGLDPPGEDEAGEREVLRVRVPRRVPAAWGDVRRVLRRVAGEWLPNETCVELVAAEVLSAIRLEADPAALPPLARRCRAGASELEEAAAPPPAAVSRVAISPFVAALAEGLGDADPRELDARLCRAAALERTWLAMIGSWLLAFVDARGPHRVGFRSLDAFARERLGWSPRAARAPLRIERACARSPAFAAAWRAGRLTAAKAQTVVPLVLAPGSAPFHPAWLARAESVTARRLGDDVDHAIETGAFDPARLPALPAGVQIGARPMRDESSTTWLANVPADVGRLFRACLYSMQRRLSIGPAAALEAMFAHCLATWRWRAPREYRVFEREGWRCTVRGCTSYRNLHARHGVHAGVIRIAGRAPGALVFELPLGSFASGDRAIGSGGYRAAAFARWSFTGAGSSSGG